LVRFLRCAGAHGSRRPKARFRRAGWCPAPLQTGARGNRFRQRRRSERAGL